MVLRAVSAVRISVKKDESTSPERQEEANALRADASGAVVVGVAADLNVSASKIEPFSRPGLGPWLNDRTDEFDILIFWRMDRAVRSMGDLHALVQWARKYEKALVFCEGVGTNLDLDFTDGKGSKDSSTAVLMATIIAYAAQIESQAISERVTSSHAYLRTHGEWGGGVVPYGYEPRQQGTLRGWKLYHDPNTYPIVREIVERAIDHENLTSIAADLNVRGVLSPRDYWDSTHGRDPKGRQWSMPALSAILRSRALLGESIYKGKPVLHKDGSQVMRGEPIVRESEWADIQSALADRSITKTRYTRQNTLLSVAFCARCGLPYYLKQDQQKGKVYTGLICKSKQTASMQSCGQPNLSMAYAEELTSRLVLELIGAREVQRRKYLPGDDKSEELALIIRRKDELAQEWDFGLSTDRDKYLARMSALVEREKAIGAEPIRAARYEWHGTGQTYAEMWPKLSPGGQRRLLMELGIRVFLGRGDGAAAEQAWAEQGGYRGTGSPQTNFRLSVAMSEAQVAEMLHNVTDGRIKKDFRVWLLQESVVPLREAADATNG